MKKLMIRPHLYDSQEKKASSVEGFVVGAEYIKNELLPEWIQIVRERAFGIKEDPKLTTEGLSLKIDSVYKSFQRYWVPNARFRVDVGERIVLYSVNDFRWSGVTSHDGLVDALQILDEKGNVKFQSVHRNGIYFRNEGPSE